MALRLTLLAFSVAFTTIAGCYTGSSVDTNRAPAGPAAEIDRTEPTGQRDGGRISPKAADGLPCDVAAILALIGAAVCLAAIGYGIYLMTQK